MPLTNGSVVSLSIPSRLAQSRRDAEADVAADGEVVEDFAIFFDVPLLTGPGKEAKGGNGGGDPR
jgi:hypothetical protein